MERKREDILKQWKRRPYLEYGKHEKLVILSLCPDPYCEDFSYDYVEIVFTVPVEWLLDNLALYDNKRSHWRWKELSEWLKNEYTSDDSEQIFNDAMVDQKIVTLNFNF